MSLFEKYGYQLVEDITWVKQTVNGRIAKGNGHYLQHAKETCLVGYKGDLSEIERPKMAEDIIFAKT